MIDLIHTLQGSYSDNVYVAVEAIIVLTIFIGVYGSYKHDRNYLITCALILVINIIVGIFAKNFPYYSTAGSVLLIVLTVAQSELIKRGYH